MWSVRTMVDLVNLILDDPDEADQFQRLLQELVLVVEERDNIVQQVEMDRVR